MSIYKLMVQRLKTMDEKQLAELWKDVEDVNAVQRICDTSYQYTNDYDYEGCESVDNCSCERTDEQQIDDSQRYKDIKAEQR